VSAKKTERLLNLVICLLATRRYLTVQEIRQAVPGYDQDTEEASGGCSSATRTSCVSSGIPLETGTNSAVHDDEPGYRIARRDYELPDIHLEPDEAAALGLAARLWQSAPLARATGSALLKLRAAGVETPAAPAALEPRVGASEPAFEACLAAVRDGRAVRFTYRTAGRAEPEARDVEPWGVVSWRGRWYLVGHDAAAAPRVFRLSRIVGDVTAYGRAGAVTPRRHDLRASSGRIAGAGAAHDRPRPAACGCRAGACAGRPRRPSRDGERLGRRRGRLLRPRALRRPGHRLRRRRRRAGARRGARGRRTPAGGAADDPGRAATEHGTAASCPRLLALVPYLLARPGVRVADVAATFGVPEERLRKDLDLLWVAACRGTGRATSSTSSSRATP
jgi:proteasome accessory factor B